MPITQINKIIEQSFNYPNSIIKEMTDFFETGVENLEPKEDKNEFSKASKKRKRADSDSSVVESEE